MVQLSAWMASDQINWKCQKDIPAAPRRQREGGREEGGGGRGEEE